MARWLPWIDSRRPDFLDSNARSRDCRSLLKMQMVFTTGATVAQGPAAISNTSRGIPASAIHEVISSERCHRRVFIRKWLPSCSLNPRQAERTKRHLFRQSCAHQLPRGQHASRVTSAKGAFVRLGIATCAWGGGSAGRVCQSRAIHSSNGAVSDKAGSTGSTSAHQTANCTCPSRCI